MAKRFVWRFDMLRRTREREEERIQQELAEALGKFRAEERELERLQELHAENTVKLREKQTGVLNSAEMSTMYGYRENIRRMASDQVAKLELAQSIVNEKQEILTKAVQERKVLDSLRERDYNDYRKEIRRRDQAEMDEIANRRPAAW